LQLIRNHPFATYGVVALLLFVVIQILNLQYDDGGVGTALIISSPIWGFVYWAPQELFFTLNDGKAFFAQSIVSFGVGFLACLLADYFLVGRKNRDEKQD
jgi:hypothetical protein